MRLALTPNRLLRPPPGPPEADRPPEIPLAAVTTFRRRASKRDFLHLLHVQNAARELDRLPEPEETVHGIMRGTFHGWDLIPALLSLAGPAAVDCLSVSTLGFNFKNLRELVSLLDAGRIRRVTLICSLYFRRTAAAEFAALAEAFAERGQTLASPRTHAKVQALQLADGRGFTIESSANLRSCRNLEQFTLTNSPGLAAFHARWIEEVARETNAAEAAEAQTKQAAERGVTAGPAGARARAAAAAGCPRAASAALDRRGRDRGRDTGGLPG